MSRWTKTFDIEAVSITKRAIEIVASASDGDEVSLAIETVDGVLPPKAGAGLTVSFGRGPASPTARPMEFDGPPELLALIDRLARIPRQRGANGIFTAAEREELSAASERFGKSNCLLAREVARRRAVLLRTGEATND